MNYRYRVIAFLFFIILGILSIPNRIHAVGSCICAPPADFTDTSCYAGPPAVIGFENLCDTFNGETPQCAPYNSSHGPLEGPCGACTCVGAAPEPTVTPGGPTVTPGVTGCISEGNSCTSSGTPCCNLPQPMTCCAATNTCLGDVVCSQGGYKDSLITIRNVCDSVGPGLKSTCESCMKATSEGGKGGAWTAIGCLETENPSAFIGTLLTFGIGIAGGIAFLLILLGGFQMMTAAGNPEQLNAGKELVGSAITGLLLIVFSVFILRVIGVDILGIPGFE